ncbi:MAG TPA: type I 3-dehydroquinate dehydratase [Tenuifilaceae bacterium]|nr:type I 3-dehydroquinate dehydratase [Tenuifilaceae bacterium]
MTILRKDICVSIGINNFDIALEAVGECQMAELRLDLVNFSDDQLRKIYSLNRNIIATFRTEDEQVMKQTLIKSMDFGAGYIDIDINTSVEVRTILVEYAMQKGAKVILSYHNFSETPETVFLKQTITRMFNDGADFAKVACMANSKDDSKRVVNLYSDFSNLIAFCMGKNGQITRVVAPFLGAPFTYASLRGVKTAEGQIDAEQLEILLNMMEKSL